VEFAADGLNYCTRIQQRGLNCSIVNFIALMNAENNNAPKIEEIGSENVPGDTIK
jgi:hypothetical protein